MAALGRLVKRRWSKTFASQLGSVAPVPLRLRETERAVLGKHVDDAFISPGERNRPPPKSIPLTIFDRPQDIARPSLAISWLNFCVLICDRPESGESSEFWRDGMTLPTEKPSRAILPCCGSQAWAHGMAARRPFPDEAALLAASDETWRSLARSDWMEAFRSHPRIGESRTPDSSLVRSSGNGRRKNNNVAAADAAAKAALADANREYERKF